MGLSPYTQHHVCEVHAIAHLLAVTSTAFFSMAEYYSIGYYTTFSYPSIIVRHLGCFHLWVIVNGGAMNIRGKVLVATFIFNSFG